MTDKVRTFVTDKYKITELSQEEGGGYIIDLLNPRESAITFTAPKDFPAAEQRSTPTAPNKPELKE